MPTIVPGGSSSGSAVAVARGLVAFALGTDTAGSGRVPAGLNNIVGLKPSVGAVSTSGVVPACRTLDCVSVFAGTVDDAWAVYAVMAGEDKDDPFSRPIALGRPGPVPPHAVIGIPRPADQKFFGDAAAKAAWRAGVKVLKDLGAELVEIDMAPFNEVAALLYEGPWVAERYAAIGPFLAKHAREVHPVTRRIIDKAKAFSAADAFAGLYRLEALKRATEPVWRRIDALAVPTAPCAPTLAEVAADPIGPNSRLGTYTNFVNLLDLAAIAVPGPLAQGRPRRRHHLHRRRAGRDAALASLARAFHAAAATTIGATGRPLPPLEPLPATAPAGTHRACRGGRASLRHGAQPRAARARRRLPARRRDRARPTSSTRCRAARRSARAWCASPPAPAMPSPPRCGRCRPRASAASSPASRRRSASARSCSPTAPVPRASCARPRPSAPPATSPPSAAGAPTSRRRGEA